ncbi:hypothetical protein N431DRAFT_461665 [Stipitochalara longipes BDJ]|nr:hypothetical protein N431DRAFT_461665 [Stipitochalara longipes BDJ]
MARSRAESHHNDAWKKDILLLICIMRLRVQPEVPYNEIADILLKTLSKHHSGITEKATNLAKLPSATCSNTTLANSTSADLILANSTSVGSLVVNNEDDEKEMWMKEWLVQYLEGAFMGAEIQGDQAWWRARDMDSGVIGELLRAAGLDGRGYVVASKEEMKVQVRWRREGNWRAGSVPEGLIVQTNVGTIGDR